MEMTMSEKLRDLEKQVPDEAVRAIYNVHEHPGERNQVLRNAAAILHTHLTTGSPEAFFAGRVGAFVLEADVYLSDKEQERYWQGLKRPFPEDHDVVDDLNQISDKDHTILTFGAKPNETGPSSDGPRPWVVGTVMYVEPSDRMIGPEHSDMEPVTFAREFMDRGGMFMVLDVPKRFRKRVAAAIDYVKDSVEKIQPEEDGQS